MGLFRLISAATIFLGALLLFLVQPLIGKYVLPWFGGGTQVWTTCLLFFQGILLAGYAYAHLSIRLLGPRGQAGLHVALLLAGLAALPIIPGAGWKPAGSEHPAGRILLLLAACLGLPCLALAATGPLLQAWVNRLTRRAPYRLYALSNVGSLAALLAYPFLLEPHVSRTAQAWAWSVAWAGFALLCGACAWRAAGARAAEEGALAAPPAQGPPEEQGPPGIDLRPATWGRRLLWLALPACACLLLMAFTTTLCRDVGPMPFLWVLPLGIYLGSFIVCFDGPRWYRRPVFAAAWVAAMMVLVPLLSVPHPPVRVVLVVWPAALLACCMVCHGELYRLRPAPAGLTGFYLLIAAGGALGGLLAAVAAPRVFSDFHELGVGLVACPLLLLAACYHDPRSILHRGRHKVWWACALAGVAPLVVALGLLAGAAQRDRVGQWRNFYGVLSVCRVGEKAPGGPGLYLVHGQTIHGYQYTEANRLDLPTAYYVPSSGIGLAMELDRAPGPRRIGVVGLGIGTIAAYAREGDRLRFYEINPQVRKLAEGVFQFLPRCRARVETVLGDARLSMEREAPQGYDLLVLDAFSSDSVPAHLLTTQAFDVYRRHLAPGGLIAVNITNQYYDLRRPVAAQARRLGLSWAVIPYHPTSAGPRLDELRSTWMLLAAEADLLSRPQIARSAQEAGPPGRDGRDADLDRALWTDDYSDLLAALK